MARLTYGGYEIKVLSTEECSRVPIYTDDGQTELLEEWTIEVIGFLNPMATAVNNDGTVPPPGIPGPLPADTDRNVRQNFRTARLQLMFTDAGVPERTILQCPAAGYTTDAKAGPFPRHFDIIQITGTKTFVVRFRIQCYVRECGAGPTSDLRPYRKVVLSHRWNRYVDIDEDHFSTVVTEGEVVFDYGQLLLQGVNVDAFRDEFGHPIPNGFAREMIHVNPSSDGTSATYKTVDREWAQGLYYGFPGTRVEAYHTEFMSLPSLNQNMFDAGVGMSRLVANSAMILAQSPVSGGLQIAAGGLNISIDQSIRSLPQTYSHIVVRVWGNNYSTRDSLQAIAVSIAFGRLGLSNNFLPTVEARLTHDLMGKFVEFELTYKHGPNPATLFKCLTFYQPRGETVAYQGVPIISPFPFTVAQPAGRPPPNSNAMRGTFVGQLLAQALESPCTTPPQVSEPNNVDLNWSA